MISALLYLHLTTLKNAVLVRLRRLKQPRYLAGFAVGVLYFYYFVFRHWFKTAGNHGAAGKAGMVGVFGSAGAGTEWMQLAEPTLALILLVVVTVAWILPGARDVLRFTEAEVAFLFPAPIARSTLIHYKLLRSQLGILFSALLLGLFSTRMQGLGGSMWTHVLAYWMVFSTLNLHFIASSFTHERLLGMGLSAWRRRGIVAAVIVAACAGAYVWAKQSTPIGSIENEHDFVSYAQAYLSAPPLGWILTPFRLMVRPFLAQSIGAFLSAAGPALLIMAAHYLWVLKSQVSFEEEALAYAQKRAARQQAVKSGKSKTVPSKLRKEPFKLSPLGPKPLAFLWRGLISAGPVSYPRVWLAIAGVVVVAASFISKNPALRGIHIALAAFAPIGAVYLLLFGPLLTRRGIPQMLERLDIVKTFPIRGWQVVLGEMLTPLFILLAGEWIFLLAMVTLGVPAGKIPEVVGLLFGPAAIGLAVIAPPLIGLMISISFAAALLFPAWMGSLGGGRSAGIEVMGQRIIFSFGYMLTFVFSILPAVLLGAIPYVVIYTITHSHLPAMLAAAASGAIVLSAELAAVIWWLGERYERIDLSVELPRS